MSSNIRNHSEHLEDKKGNKDNEELVGNQKRLRLEIIKMEKLGGRNKKRNSRKKFFFVFNRF